MSTVVNNGGELTVDRERRSSEGAGVVPPFGLHDVAHETTVTDVSVDRLWSTLRWRYLYKTKTKKGEIPFSFSVSNKEKWNVIWSAIAKAFEKKKKNIEKAAKVRASD